MLESALTFSHTLLKQSIVLGDTVIDATVGNGGDTVLLAKLVGKQGKVYGFDVQEQALITTKEKLLFTGLSEQVHLFQQGHETVGKVLGENEQISGAIFNLGYLPKSDKTVITKGETTLAALEALLPHLRKGALILLVVYYGHEGGEEEKEAVLTFAAQLPQTNYHVLQYNFINQKNQPPFLLAIEKK